MKIYLKFAVITCLFMMASGCERDFDELDQANNPNTPEIFIDGFSGGLNYAAFGGSDVKAFNVDTEVKYKGTASIRIAVPDKNAPTGAYAGGVYYTNSGRDLSSYNVLTFWAKASKSASIDIIGFGNDLGENKYQAAITGVAMNTNWKKYYIPIPDPSKLTNEKGMFFYSEGPEDDKGYTFWIDEVKFEALGTVTKAIGSIMEGKDDVVSAETGATFTVNGFTTANTPQGVDQKVQTSTAYFEFSTSNPSVASVTNTGSVKVMDAGKAVINAKLGGNVAKGSLTINSTGAPILPMTIAPKPTKAANKVISIFSNEYTNVPVDYFNGYWQFSTAQIADIKVNGDDIKRYSQLNFVGIQFTMPTIDAKDMTNFHIDIWTPDNITATSSFKILLVDIGADKSFEGNDNSSHEITIPITSLKKDSWISLDIPFSSMTGLKSKNNLAQIVLSGNLPNVFVDNIYFSNDALTEPATAAPTPTKAAVNVKSVFSDTYSNIPGTDFNPNWGQSTLVTQQSIQGNNTLKYTNLNYQGTQFASAQDVSAMEFMHIDYWSANSTTLNVFLISEGPKEKASVLNVPTSGWRSVDIPLSAFDGVDLKKIIQLKIEGNGTVFFDNIYFYKAATASLVPTSAAPTPSLPQASVISLFSDTYTNVPVDNWRTDWSAATLEDLTIQGNKVKKYSKLDFVGIETVSKTVNASGMTHLHIDIWSPDFENFAIKLVDLGANGTFGGGDDVEHQVDFAKPEKSNWVSLDIPLVNFTGLTTKNNIAQYILVGRPTAATTVYVDNLYFHK